MIPPLLYLIYLLYGVPSFALYVLIIVQMCNPAYQSLFASSFFRLAKVIGFLDLACWLSFNIIFRAPLTPLLGYLFADLQPVWWVTGLYWLDYFLPIAKGFLVTFTGLNRLTALAFPLKHEKVWSKLFRPIVVTALLVSFLLTFHVLFCEVEVIRFNPDKDGYYAFTPGRRLIKIDSALVNAVFYSLVGIATLLFNGISLFFVVRHNVRRRREQHDQAAKQQFRKMEAGLFLVAVGDFLCQFCFGINQLVLFVLMRQNRYNDPLFDTLYLQLAWLVDVTTLSRPYLLLLMSKHVRVVFVKTLCCGQELVMPNKALATTVTMRSVHLSPVAHRATIAVG